MTTKPDKTSKLDLPKTSTEKDKETEKKKSSLKETLNKCKLAFLKLKPYQKAASVVAAIVLVGAVGVGIAYGVNPSATSHTLTSAAATFTPRNKPVSKVYPKTDKAEEEKTTEKDTQDKEENKEPGKSEDKKDDKDNSKSEKSENIKKESDKKDTKSSDKGSNSAKSESKDNNSKSESKKDSSSSKSNSNGSSSKSSSSKSESKPAKEKKPVYRTETIYKTEPVYEKQWVPNIVEVYKGRQGRYIDTSTGEVFSSLDALDARATELNKQGIAAGGYIDDSYDIWEKEDHGHYENVQVGTKQVAVGTRQVIDHWEQGEVKPCVQYHQKQFQKLKAMTQQV